MAGPAYWASGGEVRGRTGPMARERAVEIARFLDRQGEDCCESGDLAAAGALRRMVRELRLAIASADDWRRAAGGLSPVSLRV